jgi:hypothetical protein
MAVRSHAVHAGSSLSGSNTLFTISIPRSHGAVVGIDLGGLGIRAAEELLDRPSPPSEPSPLTAPRTDAEAAETGGPTDLPRPTGRVPVLLAPPDDDIPF